MSEEEQQARKPAGILETAIQLVKKPEATRYVLLHLTFTVQQESAPKAEVISQPLLLEQYRALASYTKANRNELNLKKGDVCEARNACPCGAPS